MKNVSFIEQQICIKSTVKQTQEQELEALANDQIVIALQSTGLFTGGGHFILLVGMTDDGKIWEDYEDEKLNIVIVF